jgi:hypothetical protein
VEARAVLAPIYRRFGEGLETADLLRASLVWEQLTGTNAGQA